MFLIGYFAGGGEEDRNLSQKYNYIDDKSEI